MEPASAKLRTVLDYVPCEACLAQPTEDQDVLCSVCRRLDRQIAARVLVRTTVVLDRPAAEPAAPVVIAPAPPAPEPAIATAPAPPPTPPTVAVRFSAAGAPLPEPRPDVAVEVVVSPLEAAPPPSPAPAEPEFEDLVDYEAPSDLYDFVAPAEARPAPVAASPPPPAEPAPADDFVFRPPEREEEAAPEPAMADEPAEHWMPEDEVVVQPEEAKSTTSPWAPPEEPEPEAEPVVPAEPAVEPEAVAEEEVVEMEILPDEPAAEPAGGSDLWRLPGFDREAEERLGAAGIREVPHLAGHDAGELAERTGVPATRLAPWVHVADLTQEVGVPMDAALALVAAGIEGPRGLREMDAEAIVERVKAFAATDLPARDVKRWKRRA
jgi:hypothetical protein